ncbi:hypothetical protein AGMMS49942_23170 [Spirochaetia bacterium]|nr:hypothetical protein AGMMS49942_23170 [Spirochaetia bacterium]
MPVIWLGFVFLACASPVVTAQEMTPPSVEVSPEELAEFRLTWYTEKETIPLENLVTPAGIPFNPQAVAGKYVVLNFWATWCPYCAKEKPSIQQLYQENESDTLTVLTVSLGEAIDTVKEYMESNQYTFPVLVNTDNSMRETWAPRIPVSYILDPQGSIIARINGNKDWTSEQAVKILKMVIKGF